MSNKYLIQPIDDGGVFDYYIESSHVEEFLRNNNLKGTFEMGGFSENSYGQTRLIQTITTNIILPEYKGGLVSNNEEFYNKTLDCWLYISKFNSNAKNVVKVYNDENEFYDQWIKGEE